MGQIMLCFDLRYTELASNNMLHWLCHRTFLHPKAIRLGSPSNLARKLAQTFSASRCVPRIKRMFQ